MQIDEDAYYDRIIARYKSEKLGADWSQGMMMTVPVNFNTDHKDVLAHWKMIMERDGGNIAINPDKFDKLITEQKVQPFFFVSIVPNFVLSFHLQIIRPNCNIRIY